MSVSCVIRNLTDKGAALDVGPQSEIPNQFSLIAVAKKKIYSCNVVWHLPLTSVPIGSVGASDKMLVNTALIGRNNLRS